MREPTFDRDGYPTDETLEWAKRHAEASRRLGMALRGLRAALARVKGGER